MQEIDIKKTYSIPLMYYFYKKIILKLYNITNPNPSNFLIYSGDIIGLGPQFFNSHEPHLVEAIIDFTRSKYGEFFLDIGANIGLISCLVHKHFDLIEVVEPNPDCIYALKKNFNIANIRNYKINEFALDDKDGYGDLMVPKHNMGGGFKVGNNNIYTEDQLANKDGFKKINNDNYNIIKIENKSSQEYFRSFFNKISLLNKKSGIIKIDIEGMEISIIKKIALTLPHNISVIIFFENLNNEIDRVRLASYFNNRKVSLYSFDKNFINCNYFKKLSLLILSFLMLRIEYSYTETSSNYVKSTDLVLKVE